MASKANFDSSRQFDLQDEGKFINFMAITIQFSPDVKVDMIACLSQ